MVMKKRLVQTIVVFAIFCLATPLYAATPWLHTELNLIKDPCGNTVILRGVDLLDLGFLEDWQGGAIAMIDRLTDKTDAQGSSPGWYPRVLRIMITPPDAVDPPGSWPHPFDPNDDDFYNNLLRPVVDYCKAKDLYAIIDWHYVANTYDHVDDTNAFWTYMAPKFANDSHVIFELFNEPINDLNGDWIFNLNDTADWLSVRTDMQKWINIVRSYAPNNLIMVAGPFYSQVIGPSAANPLTADNIVMVSHIYPGHWLDSYWTWSYQGQINTALNRYPVFMSEWGFSIDSGGLEGTITNYGQPLDNFREGPRKISNSAWVASYDWGPPMFYDPGGWPKPLGPWPLRVGEDQMGGFVKDKLYLRRNDNQPSEGNTIPPAAPKGLTATPGIGMITLDWNDNNEGDLYGYDIYRSTTPGGQTNRLNLVRSKTSAYTDTNVAVNNTYYYVVRAVDTNFNSSAYSNQVSAKPRTEVGIVGSWALGTSHTKENGARRALVFIAHAEHTAAISTTSVTYGNQPMTKVIERIVYNNFTTAYVAAYILNEAGVAAAENSTFVTTWNVPPPAFGCSSVFLENVDQTTLVGASDSNGTTTLDPIKTNPLSTINRDMVIEAATCGNLGSYTLSTGFTPGNSQTMSATATGITGHKAATGAPEMPSADFSATIDHQVIIGFVVKALAPPTYSDCNVVKADGYRLNSDLNGDCYVDYLDLEIIADYWINDCASPHNCDGGDFEPTDGVVDFSDFSDFGPQWLQCNNPEDPNCTQNW
jgi:hypothetical protein